MIGWLNNMGNRARLTSIGQASLLSGIPAKAIEKDWWVTLTLKLLFSSEHASYFAFKGGTSLSKGWGIIDRFSEDIDIALDSASFGMDYKDSPSKMFVEHLRRAGCSFTRSEIVKSLQIEFERVGVPPNLFSIEPENVRHDMPDTDPQAVYVNYSSLYDKNQYLPDRVKVEFSVRSRKEPNEQRPISSLLKQLFPSEIYGEEISHVTTVHPARTFIEKILLLHEEYNRNEKSKMRTDRMSRHYYDIHRILQMPEYVSILGESEFIDNIIEHRKSYSRLRRFDYDTLKRGRISIVPDTRISSALRDDYRIMSSEMMYGEIPTFEDIMKSAEWIEQVFNSKG